MTRARRYLRVMDPVDRIIAEQSPESARHLLVMDAPGLVETARELAGRVSVWCDDRRDADLVPEELLIDRLDEETLAGVDLVWMRLPKSLTGLDDYSERIAAYADHEVQIVAAARTRHMTLSMNDTLGKHFSGVSASLGQYKCRALFAVGPKPKRLKWPKEKLHPDLGIGVIAHGNVFATNTIDDGTRLLAQRCSDLHGDALADLGCGSGVLATLLAKANRQSTVHAIDTSKAAVDSAGITAEANGQQVQTTWAWQLGDWEPNSLDVIVINPPFHRGIAKDSEPALGMFADAGRLLRPGGQLWCVYNSHLPWKARLNELVGPTKVEQQTPFYTLTSSVAR